MAVVGRLHGRYAVCTVGNTSAVLNLFDWEVEIHTEFADATAHGDFWDVPVPLKYRWTARARGYMSGSTSYLQAFNAAQPATSDVVAANFIGYRDATPTNIIFQGSGFVERAHFAAPMAMVEQEIELRGVGNPATIT